MVGHTSPTFKVMVVVLLASMIVGVGIANAQQAGGGVQVPIQGYGGGGGPLIPGAGPLFFNATLGCSYEEMENTAMFVPVSVGVFYPPTSSVALNRTSANPTSTITEYETSTPQMDTITLTTNNTNDQFTYHFDIKYPQSPTTPKTVTFEVLSMGQIVKMDRVPVTNEFCKDIRIITTTKPQPETLEQLLGQTGVNAINDMQNITPAVNQNTDTVFTGEIIQIGQTALLIIFIGVLVFYKFYGSKKQKDTAKLLMDTVEKLSDMSKTYSFLVKNQTLMKIDQERWLSEQLKAINSAFSTLLHGIGFDASLVLKSFEDTIAEFAKKHDLTMVRTTESSSQKILSDTEEITKNFNKMMEIPELPKPVIEEKTFVEKIKDIPGSVVEKIHPTKEEEKPVEEFSVEWYFKKNENLTLDKLHELFDKLYEPYLADQRNDKLRNELKSIEMLIVKKTDSARGLNKR